MNDELDTGIRICSNCGAEMTEGYCWGDGEGYACSNTCLYVDGYTREQHELDYKAGGIYYTQWEPEVNHADLVDHLAQHRLGTATQEDLDIAYYETQYTNVAAWSTAELLSAIEKETGEPYAV